ncbi:MarR family winged helix-turn-helix transcriptional regulator [Streptomyces clavifer]|uniref:MarR family winged helix-turn-helix transcriptional regulator n=1 Tax=Streptomyces clavifer TaxID=68188 RepID=UPI00382F39FC
MAETVSTAGALVRLSFLVQSVYAEVSSHYDLTPQQAQLLCALRDTPLGVTELAQMLRLEKNSLSGLVDRVERRQLVQRNASPHDRRVVLISTTRAGGQVVEDFAREATQRLLDVVGPLSVEERALFEELATRIVVAEEVPALFA